MRNNRLAYSKLILRKVSFDIYLFRKELKKAYTYLVEDEFKQLVRWVTDNYGESYLDAQITHQIKS